jgi:hypothetical protein
MFTILVLMLLKFVTMFRNLKAMLHHSFFARFGRFLAKNQ